MVLIITGGSSGIGLATANLFSKKGYRVYELSRSGVSHDEIVHIKCDVTDETQVFDSVAEVFRREGRIDVLVSNAGYGISGPVEFTDIKDAKRQFDVNFFGALTAVKTVLPYMRQQGHGCLIFMSSVAAVLSIPYQSFYSASKAAINSLVLALRQEVKAFGITVSAMMPGDVKTGFTAARDKSDKGSEVYTHLNAAITAMEKDEQSGMSPNAIAMKVYNITCKKHPKPLYTTGLQYHLFVGLEKILPRRLSNYIVGKIYS